MQAKVPVLEGDDADSLASRVLAKEHIIYPQVIEWFCAERLTLDNEKVRLDQQILHEPVLLAE
jgi:phosphoribosylglycinamide formyltransferase-1